MRKIKPELVRCKTLHEVAWYNFLIAFTIVYKFSAALQSSWKTISVAMKFVDDDDDDN